MIVAEYHKHIPRPTRPEAIYTRITEIIDWCNENHIVCHWSADTVDYEFWTGRCIIPEYIMLEEDEFSCNALAFKLKFCV